MSLTNFAMSCERKGYWWATSGSVSEGGTQREQLKEGASLEKGWATRILERRNQRARLF